MNKGQKTPGQALWNPSVPLGRSRPMTHSLEQWKLLPESRGCPYVPKRFAQGGPLGASRRDPLSPAEAGMSPHRMAVQSGLRPGKAATCKGTFPPFLATRPLPKGLSISLSPVQCAQTPSVLASPVASGTPPDPGSAHSGGAGRALRQGDKHPHRRRDTVTAPTPHSRKWPRKRL